MSSRVIDGAFVRICLRHKAVARFTVSWLHRKRARCNFSSRPARHRRVHIWPWGLRRASSTRPTVNLYNFHERFTSSVVMHSQYARGMPKIFKSGCDNDRCGGNGALTNDYSAEGSRSTLQKHDHLSVEPQGRFILFLVPCSVHFRKPCLAGLPRS